MPEAFYVKAHEVIYRAALALFRAEKPTDLMMVVSYLTDRDLLEKVGGTSKLAPLIDRTVSAVNVDRYAALVMDKYLRRQLIHQANAIACTWVAILACLSASIGAPLSERAMFKAYRFFHV